MHVSFFHKLTGSHSHPCQVHAPLAAIRIIAGHRRSSSYSTPPRRRRLPTQTMRSATVRRARTRPALLLEIMRVALPTSAISGTHTSFVGGYRVRAHQFCPLCRPGSRRLHDLTIQRRWLPLRRPFTCLVFNCPVRHRFVVLRPQLEIPRAVGEKRPNGSLFHQAVKFIPNIWKIWVHPAVSISIVSRRRFEYISIYMCVWAWRTQHRFPSPKL